MVLDCLLESDALHERFRVMVKILAKLVSSAPRSVSIADLEIITKRSANDLATLCASLKRAQLLISDPKTANCWMLVAEPSSVTLEDVFRCIAEEQNERAKPVGYLSNQTKTSCDVDLLLMQAMLAVNQSVLKNLRQFSLDKVSTAKTSPSTSKLRCGVSFDQTDDFVFSASDLTSTARSKRTSG